MQVTLEVGQTRNTDICPRTPLRCDLQYRRYLQLLLLFNRSGDVLSRGNSLTEDNLQQLQYISRPSRSISLKYNKDRNQYDDLHISI